MGRGWERLQAEVLGMYGERRYEDALALIRREMSHHSDRRARMTYWEACLLCRSGRPDEALAILGDASEQGLWWSDFVWEDEDLRPILDHPTVVEIRRVSEQRRLRALSTGPDRPRLKVLSPPGDPRAIALVLHMYGGDPESTAAHWREVAGAGVAVILPESTQVGMDGRPTWDDPERTERDLLLALRTAELGPDQDAPLILAGASQGGLRALELALRVVPRPTAAYVGVVPAIPDLEAIAAQVAQARRRGFRAWLVTGDRDPGRPAVLNLHEVLTESGVASRLDDLPGLGHEYPRDFGERARAALDFLLGREPNPL